ncbi:MAG: class IIb bacteriocin, lactobin A/cerein 7B family [Richelia sp. RM2_1_2]|nr:class IIb bacteriocin, lactobin A/cerein 7B family [Richelia sp. RM1_1_1]NJO28950.1 class IIb bacteriocin, lactobin A/cerein 7B family [Richelia sp. SL_2_1]NJO62076.1 class IIb bacteriocin, lactobin A/cerein 7B family [Richelia sp. RM2_1_2]
MSSIVISDLNQESILTDLSDEQINAIQGGITPLAAAAATAAVVLLVVYVKGYVDGAKSCKA